MEVLADKLSNRDITMRLNGLADSLFYGYGEKLELIGLDLKGCEGSTLEERVDAALNKYQEDLCQFTENLVGDLNKCVRRSIKNHAEYLEKELQQLFDNQREYITKQIARTVKVSETVASEKQKQTVIKESYAALVVISNQL